MNEPINSIADGTTPVAALPTQLQSYIHISRYARWLDAENRRETWDETVNRYAEFFYNRFPDTFPKSRVADAIRNLSVMPSMRSLMTAGPALDGTEMAAFNCAAVAIDHVRAFDEILYILMAGTGMGFSVERQFINKLPVVGASVVDGEVHIVDALKPVEHVIVVGDSKIGWAKSFRELLSYLYRGEVPTWDVSGVRPAGARLKTFGGRASGPQPLVDLFEFTIAKFKGAVGRKLNSIECHDIVCKIADIVVVGGVRRSALISLSNLSDERMRGAKSGQWWEDNPQRALANNSAAYTEMPDPLIFMKEWRSLIESRSGERGVLNRMAMKKQAAKNGRRDPNHEFLTNPCSEVLLRSSGLCNLTEVVVRQGDTLEQLKEKAEIAAIMGTYQSTLTNFAYVRPIWKKTAEEERLLGVSMTGIMDHELLSRPSEEAARWLRELRAHVVATNKEWAKKLGINQSVATTVVKPSGCRPADALVTTDQGILTLEEMFGAHPIGDDWADISGYSGEYGAVTKTFVNGEAEVFSVNLGFGQTVESTANHQWGTTNRGWVRTDALVEGDVLEIKLDTYNNVSEAPFDNRLPQSAIMRCDSQVIECPEKMTPDLAWMLGYLWGDGSQSPQRWRHRWVDSKVENLAKLQRIMKEQFGLEAEVFDCKDRKASEICYASKALWMWMERNGFMKYGVEDGLNDIPKLVRMSSKESIIAFFAGWLDSDGCVGNTAGGYKVTFTTSDKRFLAHVQSVVQGLGLVLGASENANRGEGAFSQKPMYLASMSVLSLLTSVEILAKHSTKLGPKLSETVYVRPRGPAKKGRFATLGEVISVTSLGVKPTYDVETEQHWFWAGGVKSHNTVSQLVDSASGIHPRYSEYYIRTVRGDKKDPLAQYMRSVGFPAEDDVMKPETTDVFSFPVKAPAAAVMRNDMTAIEQLEHYVMFKDNWCEHMVSITVYVREEEWVRVGAWLYDHFDDVCGVSFLPHSDHSYRQAPYTECTEEEYNAAVAKMPDITNWDGLQAFEKEDSGTGTREWACTSGSCDLI